MDITITMETRELLYDITDKTHIAGVAHEAQGVDFKAAAEMKATDDEHGYQLRRTLNDAWAAARAELAEYVNDKTTTADDRVRPTIDAGGRLVMGFDLPDNFNGAATDALAGHLHEYLVDKAVFAWYLLTNKAEAADYLQLSATALDKAKRAMYCRRRPTRPAYDDLTPLPAPPSED